MPKKNGSTPQGDGPMLLADGNPKILKGDGNPPVQAYVDAMPGGSPTSVATSMR